MRPNERNPYQPVIVVWGLIVLVIGGCDHKRPLGTVFGKVTFQGQPVSEGQITFYDPSQGISMTADLQSDGSYKVVRAEGEGLPPGTYQVSITPPPTDLPVGYSSQAPPQKNYENIPTKFRSFATSGLTLTVQEADNPFDVQM